MARFLPIAALFLTGCVSDFITIERSENFAKQKKIGNIICIDPQVRILSGDDVVQLTETADLNLILQKGISLYARKNNLPVEVRTLDQKSDALYYNELLALKKEVLQANNYQNTPLNFNFNSASNTIRKKVFVYPPLISPDFASYSEKFGTPYFSYIGLYQRNKSTLFYHLIVNTQTSETVYRELKRVDRKITGGVMAQLLYDSFAMIQQELK